MIKARMNHGRWLADCPDCNGAELVLPGQKFICQSGEHAPVAHEVEFPADFVLINAAVSRRPVQNRNWQPGETVAQLLQENLAHGLD